MDKSATKNDINLSRQIFSHFKHPLRLLLFEADLWTPIPDKYYSIARDLEYGIESKQLFFHDMELKTLLSSFHARLAEFNRHVGANTHATLLNNSLATGFKPDEYVEQARYEQLRKFSNEANGKATLAWNALCILVEKTKEKCPEAFDAL